MGTGDPLSQPHSRINYRIRQPRDKNRPHPQNPFGKRHCLGPKITGTPAIRILRRLVFPTIIRPLPHYANLPNPVIRTTPAPHRRTGGYPYRAKPVPPSQPLAGNSPPKNTHNLSLRRSRHRLHWHRPTARKEKPCHSPYSNSRRRTCPPSGSTGNCRPLPKVKPRKLNTAANLPLYTSSAQSKF